MFHFPPLFQSLHIYDEINYFDIAEWEEGGAGENVMGEERRLKAEKDKAEVTSRVYPE